MNHNLTLYSVTVLIWGSTFLAIKFQLGVVDPSLSVAYRFALAAAMMLVWCRLRGLRMRFSLREHGYMAQQGLLLFSLNYVLVYLATSYLTSGLIAVVFALLPLFNIANGALFMRLPIQRRSLLGSLLGLAGICLVFLPEFANLDGQSLSLTGLMLSLAATFIASLGNLTALRNQRASLPVMQSNAYGMLYGTLLVFAYVLISGAEISFDPSPGYILSLLYLTIAGSIVAFWGFLTLVGRIGPDRAAYAMVLFPLVALGLSTLFEEYQWSLPAVAGVLLVLGGNLLVLGRQRGTVVSATRKAPADRPPG